MEGIKVNLISCNSCGVVLDANKLSFPSDTEIWGPDGLDLTKGAWSRELRDNVPFVNCPVCKHEILKES